MKSIETEGKNVEQAIELGLFKLGVKREEVKIQILEQGGLFSKAKVKLSLGKQNEDENKIQQTVQDLIASMGVDCFASVEEKEDKVLIELSGNDVGVMIGKHGDIMDQLQFLISLLVNKNLNGKKPYKIVLDSANYRERREKALHSLAERMAEKAIRDGKPVKLEPMVANERRIIHTALQNNSKVRTESKGDEPNRFLTIFPVEQKPTEVEKNSDTRIESAVVFDKPKTSFQKREYND